MLTRILLVDGGHDYEAQSRSWRDSWLRFASGLLQTKPPKKRDNGKAVYVQDATEWIGRASSRLAQSAKLLESYLTARRT